MPATLPVPTALQELEEVFDRLDASNEVEESAVDVSISGDNETSATMTVSLESSSAKVASVSGAASDPLLGQRYQIDLSILTIPDDFITQLIIAIFSRESGTGSLEGVKVKQIGSTAEYEVVDDYTYQANDYKITVPKGFRYDRASIPRIFWAVVDKDSLSNVAPLFHDLLYRYGGRLQQNQVSPYRTFSREDADELFRELMSKCGVVPWRREAAYKIVRNFAASHWNGN